MKGRLLLSWGEIRLKFWFLSPRSIAMDKPMPAAPDEGRMGGGETAGGVVAAAGAAAAAGATVRQQQKGLQRGRSTCGACLHHLRLRGRRRVARLSRSNHNRVAKRTRTGEVTEFAQGAVPGAEGRRGGPQKPGCALRRE